MNRALLRHIEQLLGENVTHIIPVAGGSINLVYCLEGRQSKYLIKVNDKHAFPGMFRAEKTGLETIAQT